MSFTITPLSSPQDHPQTLALIKSYASSLHIDLAFQEIDTELSTFPGKYVPACGGALLIARRNDTPSSAPGEIIGCVALRKLDNEGRCEIKRLYVAPEGRGMGVGKALAAAIVEVARGLGYSAVRLDTLPDMRAARGVYGGLGFVEIEAYYATPIEGTVFLELVLR